MPSPPRVGLDCGLGGAEPSTGARAMMVAIFAALSLALGAGVAGAARLAVAAGLVALSLAAALFLWEVYSPDTGFRLPWLEVCASARSIRA